ncbi:MAG: hypothetical protein WD749_06265 [Phycisphaerales bacterium]
MVRDNTRALTALELGQRAIAGVLERLASNKPEPPPGGYPTPDRAVRAAL